MKKLVVFSVAGISAESGISTFRDVNGLWENFDINDVATLEAWNRNPSLVQSFYNQRRKQVLAAQPNKAHFLVAYLERYFDVSVITQNIDDLHERGGSSNVIHLHGNIRFAKSSGPNQEKKYYPIKEHSLDLNKDFCDDNYPLRPHVVWFGEDVPVYEQVIPIIRSADIFVVIGTSLSVYPAVGLVNYCSVATKRYLIDPTINKFKTTDGFETIQENAEEGMRQLIKLITA